MDEDMDIVLRPYRCDAGVECEFCEYWIWIEHYKKKDTLLFDKNNVISLLEEFRLE